MRRPSTIILIVLAIALFYTFTLPQYNKSKVKRLEAAEYTNVIDNVEKITEKRNELFLKYESISQAELDKLLKVLPDNVDTVRLALDLDTIASRYGIAIDSVQVEKDGSGQGLIVLPEYEAPYDKVTVSFNFVSNYRNFISFLADLERSLRITNVRSIDFQVGDSSLYEHRLVIETYWLR